MGLTPLFWWPIRIEFSEKLFFHKVTVLTLFNPLHIRRKFEAAGFTTTQNKRSHYFSLRKTVEGRELRVEGLHYWLRLITDHLFSENSVVDLIDRSIDGSIVKQLPQLGGCYIRPRIEQHF
jgi:hypothetical protein